MKDPLSEMKKTYLESRVKAKESRKKNIPYVQGVFRSVENKFWSFRDKVLKTNK